MEAGARRRNGGARDYYRVKVDLDGKSLQEEQMGKLPRKWKRSKGTDWTEMRKEEKRFKCTLLNGSAWSTEKKYMRRYKGTFDIFFGIKLSLRKEEMEEQLNKEAKRKDGNLRQMRLESRM